jgi:hypothetical protein
MDPVVFPRRHEITRIGPNHTKELYSMSNLLKDFLANRVAKPITNEAQPVTRAEFSTLVRVVEALVEDVQIATSPEKLTAAMNAAVKPLLDGLQVNGAGTGRHRPPLALKADRGFIAPPGDDDIKVNAKGARPPLALKADRAYLAPKGDD